LPTWCRQAGSSLRGKTAGLWEAPLVPEGDTKGLLVFRAALSREGRYFLSYLADFFAAVFLAAGFAAAVFLAAAGFAAAVFFAAAGFADEVFFAAAFGAAAFFGAAFFAAGFAAAFFAAGFAAAVFLAAGFALLVAMAM
jgi:hypothetical protein